MYLTFAEQLRKILKERNLTIEQFAETMGISRQNLNQKLLRNNFDERAMREVAFALKCDCFVSLDAINVEEHLELTRRGPGRPKKKSSEAQLDITERKLTKSEEVAIRKAKEQLRSRYYTDMPHSLEEIQTAKKTLPEDGESMEEYAERIYRLTFQEPNVKKDESVTQAAIWEECMADPNATDIDRDIMREFFPMDYETKQNYIDRINQIRLDKEKQKDIEG